MALRQGEMSAIELGRTEPGMEDFLLNREARGAKEPTLRNYANHMGMVRRRSPKPLLELTTKEATALAAKIARMPSGYSLSITVRMFYAHHFGKEDPRAQVFHLRKSRKRLNPKDILLIEDINAMLRAASTKRDAALLAVLWETGARIHEVLALDRGNVTRLESGTRTLYRVFLSKVKVEGEEHSVLLVEAAPHLQAWLRAYPLAPIDVGPLFPTADHGRFGQRMTTSGARLVLREMAKRAQVTKRVNPHSFRHARATHLLRIGMKEANVKKTLGWTPNSTMLGRYSHLADEDAQREYQELMGLKVAEAKEMPKLEEPVGAIVPAMPIADPEVFEERKAMAWLLTDPQIRLEILGLIRRAAQRQPPA